MKEKPRKTKPTVVVVSGKSDVAHDLSDALATLKLEHHVTQNGDGYDTADIVVFLDEKPELIEKAKKSQCVPVALKKEGRENYNPVQEHGNGFYFEHPTKWEVFAAVVRACETYQFPYDWQNLLRSISKN